MLLHDFDLQVSQIQALSNRDAVVALFASLGYSIESRLVQTTAAMGFDVEALSHEITHVERIADYEGELQVYLVEMKHVTVSLTQALARALRNRAGNFLLVLTADYEQIDFVLMELVAPESKQSGFSAKQAYRRPRTLTIDRRNPSTVDLRVLRRFSYTEADAWYQWDKLRSAYGIADWSEPFFDNRALFSDYYISERLKDTAQWAEDAAPALQEFQKLLVDARQRMSGKVESVVRSELIEPALRALGFKVKQGRSSGQGALAPDYNLYIQESAEPIGFCNAHVWGRNLDGRDETRDTETPDENPGALVVSLLEQEHVPDWGIVTNGKTWRLYSARTHSRATNYYEIDLEEAINSPDPQFAFRYFWLFFRAPAFQRDANGKSFLDSLVEESALYAKELGERLKDRVFEEIFPHFAEGFVANIRNREGGNAKFEQERLDTIFHGTLTFVYRLLFLLYAEARDLVPVRDVRGYYETSLTQLKQEVAERAGGILDEAPDKLARAFSPGSTQLYDRLTRLFQIIAGGKAELNVPLYNGGLFITDPTSDDNTPEAANARFLSGNKIPDRFLALGLDLMARDLDDKTQALVMIDYKSLGVRQLGSIYEGLLEFKLHVAAEKLAVVKGKKTDEIMPFRKAKGSRIRKTYSKGDIYIENDKHERKATGSYYTPDYIVKYIVEHTVGPVLQEKCEALRPRLREAQKAYRAAIERQKAFKKAGQMGDDPEKVANTFRDVVDSLFDLRVLDPAMGSGHFLVEAVDFITDHMITFLNGFPWNPVMASLRQTRETILDQMQQQGVTIDETRLTDVNLLKRHVLKRCIYGVDLNPMAVELAKVSLWLDCFTLGAPLSFLDHHLKCGNSLIGAQVTPVRAEIEMQQQTKRQKTVVSAKEYGTEKLTAFQFDMFGSLWTGAMMATDLMRQVGELSDVTAAQVKESRVEFRKASDALAPFKRILDVYTSRWFGNGPNKAQVKAGLEPTIDFLRRPDAEDWVKDPERVNQRLSPEMKRVGEAALRAAAEKRFFHWELEFPEVFFGPSEASAQEIAAKDNGGFDAVVGNPPYDILAEKERAEDLTSLNSYVQDQAIYRSAMGRKIDLFRLFVARDIELVRRHCRLGHILPMSLLADQQAAALRKHLLESHGFARVDAFPQKDDPNRRIFIEAKLPTCVVVVPSRPEAQQKFQVVTHPGKLLDEVSGSYFANRSEIEAFDPINHVIPLVSTPVAFRLATRLSGPWFVRFGDLAETYQGEINETTMAHLISDNPNDGPRILRGGNIQRYGFLEDAKQGENKYLRLLRYQREISGERAAHATLPRIGYQRNAALDNWRRLIFGPMPSPCHCFDSISYLLIEQQGTYSHLAILNSSLQEWRFRLTSSNNHVSTEEVAALPMRRINYSTPASERKEHAASLIRKYENRADADLLGTVDKYLPKDAEGTFLAFLPGATGTEENSDVVHDLLAYLANQMIEMNKQKQAEQKRLLAWMEGILKVSPDKEGNTGIDVLTGKTTLQGYLGDYQKGEEAGPFDAIVDVLQKNRTRLGISLSDARIMAKLKAEYEKSLGVLLPIKERLARTDALIDQVVYRLYGLTEEEIAVVEGKTE